jgi:hypothetical protein
MARIRCNWVASLSDGSTKTEQGYIDEGQPAYGSLLKLLKETGAKLTGFRLQRDGITHNAPSLSPKAAFPSDIPFELDHRRRAIMSSKGDSEEFLCNYTVRVTGFTGAIKFWVDEETGETHLQLVKEMPK